MAVPVKGSNVTVHIPNAEVADLNPTTDFILITLPGDPPVQYWIPLTDPRVQVTQSLPANWPPAEGDVWVVPNITPEAWVVNDGQGHMFFVTPDNVRQAYTVNKPPLPMSTDQALAQYGTALTLRYRKAVG